MTTSDRNTMAFGWSIFRRPLLWGTLAWLACMMVLIAFVAAMIALLSMPTAWTGATAIKICGGLPIVQREDGTVWLLHRSRAYRVNLDKLECVP